MNPKAPLFHVSSLTFKRHDREVPNFLAWVNFNHFENLLSNLDVYFSKREIATYQKTTSNKKQKTYLLGRYAIKLAAGYFLDESSLNEIEVVSTVVQYPVIRHLSRNTPEVTLSHCDPLALALAHEAGHVVGLDIEKKSPSKIRVFERSMTPDEISLCRGIEKVSYKTLANLLWTVHESLSKAIKCGFSVSFKLLEIKNLTVHNAYYHFTFRHFAHLHSYAYVLDKHILSITLPIKTQVVFNKQDIRLC